MIDGTGRVHCCRCGQPSPLVLDPADGGGDPELPQVVVPPLGFIGSTDADEQENGIVCGDCAAPEEITEWMADLAELEE